MKYPVVSIKKGKQRSTDRFHPWIFSGAIASVEGNPDDGDIVSVKNDAGGLIGTGFYHHGSIAVRILAFEELEVNARFWETKIAAAWKLRQNIGLADADHTTIFRLVHAEGDLVPGLIVDVYGQVAVIQAHHQGIFKFRQVIADAILKVSDGRILSVFDKSSETLPLKSTETNGHLAGVSQLSENSTLENGLSFNIDWVSGQKTGFFIDQRENRKLLATYSKGKKVLNTFCYTGGFSVYALNAGAELVHSVDSSQSAIEGCNINVELLGAGNRHESFRADAIQFLKELPVDYDVIVLDPPAFAKHVKAKHQAIQAYKRLNAHAIRQIKPGGVLFTFSCSQVVDKYLFNNTVLAAAIECRRSVRILHQLHQPADHPVNIFHPESEYLKGLVLQID